MEDRFFIVVGDGGRGVCRILGWDGELVGSVFFVRFGGARVSFL